MPSPPQPDLPALLRLAIEAWPALDNADVDGWLWRASGGGSKRANSVSTLAFGGRDLETTLATLERRYGALDQPCRIQVEDVSRPSGLAERLSARGYTVEEATRTMVKAVTAQPSTIETCRRFDAPTPDWLSVYLSAITPDRRAVNQQILRRVPTPRAFFLAERDGAPASSGLAVVSGGNAIVECMATRADARRGGGARAILAAIEAWAADQGARTLFLQVVSINAPAIALYERAGYRLAATTRYYVKGLKSPRG